MWECSKSAFKIYKGLRQRNTYISLGLTYTDNALLYLYKDAS